MVVDPNRDSCISLFLFLVIFVTPLPNCHSPSRESSSNTAVIGGQKYKIRDLRSGGRSLELTTKEKRQAQEKIVKLMQRYTSEQPEVWRETTRTLLGVGEQLFPERFRSRIKTAKEQTPAGKKARNQLARWGRLKQILLQLPTTNRKTWDNVRKKMFSKGTVGKQMFIQQMLDFMNKPNQNRTLASRQLARCGEVVIDKTWKNLLSLARKARKTRKKGKAIKGVMIYLVGLAEVIVHAQQWKRVKTALNHQFLRVRGAMTRALSRADHQHRAVRLAGEHALNDSNTWIRTEAVGTLRAQKTVKAMDYLEEALLDEEPSVAIAAAEALPYFYDHKRKALKSLLYAMRKRTKNERLDKNLRQAMFSAMRNIADKPNMENNYQDWRMLYQEMYVEKRK